MEVKVYITFDLWGMMEFAVSKREARDPYLPFTQSHSPLCNPSEPIKYEGQRGNHLDPQRESPWERTKPKKEQLKPHSSIHSATLVSPYSYNGSLRQPITAHGVSGPISKQLQCENQK